MARIVRPRRGDLSAALQQHSPVPSGECVGAHVEICDLCGMTFPNQYIHPVRMQPPGPGDDYAI
jgi:hypothetical protein